MSNAEFEDISGIGGTRRAKVLKLEQYISYIDIPCFILHLCLI